jgi:hypothetical protein
MGNLGFQLFLVILSTFLVFVVFLADWVPVPSSVLASLKVRKKSGTVYYIHTVPSVPSVSSRRLPDSCINRVQSPGFSGPSSRSVIIL